ncbi:MAG: hypothetical protein ABJH28_20715 [Paraglaciecola sp.]|uniref:hypothetical protein n=2 Tax=Paraglaciecola sp. TaxID=1920173 RepID=UPI00326561C7
MTPISHYLTQLRIIRNSIFISSERFLAIISLLIAVFGMVYLYFEDDYALRDIAFYLFIFIFLSPYFAFNLSRVNAMEFSQIISGGKITDSELIKNSAYEAYRVVEYVYRYIGKGEEVGLAVQRMKDSIRICDELKVVLSERLKVTPRELSDDFLKFSGSLFVNRCNKLVDLENLVKNAEKIGDATLSNSANKDAKAIKRYFEESKNHLWALMHSDINLDNISLIFQTRSVSGATRQLIKFVENERCNIHTLRDLRLIIDLQKTHRTGSSAHKAIGLAITYFLRIEDPTPEDEEKLVNRIKCLSDWYLSTLDEEHSKKTAGPYLKSFDEWHQEADDFVMLQRREIGQEFARKFEAVYTKHINEERKGNLYVVISSYSRAVRAVLKHVLSKEAYQNVQFVVCSENVGAGDYSSRLMYQQILEEFYINDEHYEKEDTLYWNTWRSSFEELENRLVNSQDSILYLAGCDQIELKFNSKGNEAPAVFKYSPMSMLNVFQKNHDDIDVTAFIIAGEYKCSHANLCAMLPADLQEAVTGILPKPRRSCLHQWIDDKKGIRVELISSECLEGYRYRMQIDQQ